jgi:hypothetical protein
MRKKSFEKEETKFNILEGGFFSCHLSKKGFLTKEKKILVPRTATNASRKIEQGSEKRKQAFFRAR